MEDCSVVIESVNYNKCHQANSSSGLFVKTVSTLSVKAFSAYRVHIFFCLFLLLYICFWFWKAKLFPISDQKENEEESISVVSEHGYLNGSGILSEHKSRKQLRDRGQVSWHVGEPIMKALVELGLAFPIVHALTSEIYSKAPQPKEIRKIKL